MIIIIIVFNFQMSVNCHLDLIISLDFTTMS